jgi:hypothetical protein
VLTSGRWLRWLLVVFVLGGLGVGAVSGRVEASASPQDTPGLSLAARAGFDGYYKEGSWVPVRITVANDGPDVRATLRLASPRDYSSAETIITRAVELPTQSRREMFVYVAPEGLVSNLRINLVDGERVMASTTLRLIRAGPGDLLYGVLAGSPSAFNGLADVDPISGSAFVAHLEVGDLPPAARGWQALDVLVVSDVDTGALTPEQRAALTAWVAGGGRLIVAGGPTWQKTAAGLGDLLPLSPAGAQTLSVLEPLAAFAAASTPEGSAVAARGPLADGAITLAEGGGTPLVVTRRSGFGQVTFLAVDPAFAPLRGWDGFEGLFRNILAMPFERPSWATGFHNWSSGRDAVNALPTLELPSTLQICGFLSVYLIVVGPLNYLVLKRLRRRELAWATIPAIVLFFSAATYLSGYQLRGTQATLHQLTLVQVWAGSDHAQVDQLVGLFSPRRLAYDLRFARGFLVRPLPTYGSYNSAANSLALEQADSTSLLGLRADVGAVEAFVVQGHVPAPRFESDLTLEVVGGGVRLAGTVTNLSDLTLTDAVVIGPGGSSGVQRLGEFKPGETRNVSLRLPGSRAAQAPLNVVTPAMHNAAGLPSQSGYYPSSNYDSTVDDILGSANYYNDRHLFRRYALLSTAIDTYGSIGRGNGIYLVGWTAAAPVSAQVLNRSYTTLDSTAYLVALRPRLDLGSETLTLPPGLMTWMVLDAGRVSSPTPYDTYLYSGQDSYGLRFMPAQPVLFSRVQELVLHLDGYGLSGPADVFVDLWDFTEHTWARQAPLFWGDNDVSAPTRFVGPAGELQVRVALPSHVSQVSIEALDFTLVVAR